MNNKQGTEMNSRIIQTGMISHNHFVMLKIQIIRLKRYISSEDIAILFKCNKIQKLIFAKRPLKEFTNMYIQSKDIKWWTELKLF